MICKWVSGGDGTPSANLLSVFNLPDCFYGAKNEVQTTEGGRGCICNDSDNNDNSNNIIIVIITIIRNESHSIWKKSVPLRKNLVLSMEDLVLMTKNFVLFFF